MKVANDPQCGIILFLTSAFCFDFLPCFVICWAHLFHAQSLLQLLLINMMLFKTLLLHNFVDNTTDVY